MQDQNSFEATTSPHSSATYGARLMDARFGVDVYKTSVKLFERHPLQVFLLGLAILLFCVIQGFAPSLLQLLLSFVAPIVWLGALRAIQLFDSTTQTVTSKQVVDIFFDPTRKEDYLILGAINLGFQSLVIALRYTSTSGGLLAFVVFVLYTAATFFGYPLVEFDRVKPIEALKASLSISKLNWKPAVVYALATLVFFILSLCALGVGFFIFFPLMLVSRYVGYKIILNK